jgi:hypothetical protein
VSRKIRKHAVGIFQSGTMTWTSVEVVCDCPGRIESWQVSIDGSKNVTLANAKEHIREKTREHFDESKHCNLDTVEMKVYYEQEVPA